MLYKSLSVWVRQPKGLYRYRVFENLDTGFFSVQNRDFFGLEADVPLNSLRDLERIFVELLIEKDPENRCPRGSLTIKEAIELYDSTPYDAESGIWTKSS